MEPQKLSTHNHFRENCTLDRNLDRPVNLRCPYIKDGDSLAKPLAGEFPKTGKSLHPNRLGPKEGNKGQLDLLDPAEFTLDPVEWI